jgi:hypothetical protein
VISCRVAPGTAGPQRGSQRLAGVVAPAEPLEVGLSPLFLRMAGHHRRVQPQRARTAPAPAARRSPAAGLQLVPPAELGKGRERSSGDLQQRAWQWALANRAADGSLPSGSAIARAHGRKERWGAPGQERWPGRHPRPDRYSRSEPSRRRRCTHRRAGECPMMLTITED